MWYTNPGYIVLNSLQRKRNENETRQKS